MIIRVDKCVTFGMRKGSTKSMQFQPKLIINSELVPPVKMAAFFDISAGILISLC